MKLVKGFIQFLLMNLYLMNLKANHGLTYQKRVRGAIYGSMISDALCLGSHYEYDAIKIK